MPITTDHYLYLSGTPFRAIADGEFIEEQIFNWTYSDEQRAKSEWVGSDNPYAALPRMVMLTYKHAWMRQWADGHDIQVAFAETQTDPLRRQLCGLGVWHRCDRVWVA